MKFYIHTLGRPNNQPTLIALQAGGVQPTLVVQPHEAQSYRQIYKASPILVLPKEIKGLSATRQWLLENCDERYMVLCDDDIRFSRRNPENKSRLLDITPLGMSDMIKRIRRLLQFFAHVGVSARGGNNTKPEQEVEVNDRAMRILAYDRERVPSHCRFDRVPCKQDFDMTLQLLRAGLPNAVLFEFAQDQVKASNAPGGCATYRTEQMADEAAQELHRLHPDFVSLVQKDNNNWKGFTKPTRLEVKIFWKRAFQAGKTDKIGV